MFKTYFWIAAVDGSLDADKLICVHDVPYLFKKGDKVVLVQLGDPVVVEFIIHDLYDKVINVFVKEIL